MNTAIKNSALAVVLAGGVLATLHAPDSWAADPYLSGPSVMGIQERAVFAGGNFPPNVALRMIVNYPDKTQFKQVVLADGAGSLNYQVALTTAGRYTLVVRDLAGKLLKSTAFVVSQ